MPRYAAPFPASFTVRLNHAVNTTVTVDYATSGGSAQAVTDFTAVSGTLTFAPGETTKTVRVPIVNDSLTEPTETFTINLSNASGGVITDGQAIGTIEDDENATRFYVVNDASPDRTYEYNAAGAAKENYALNGGNTQPRGAASTAAGDRVWVVDANRTVYVYNTIGTLLGSWTAGSFDSSSDIQGIATNGTDIWIVDAKSDKVFLYAGAASRLSGSQTAGSFWLPFANWSPKDIVTDGTYIWVLNDSTTDKVFKYLAYPNFTLQGSWTITGGGGSPTGITLDPTGASQDLWIVDSGTDKVYQYAGARSRTSGSQSASATFALAAGNTNPQGIADPPTGFSPAAPTPSRVASPALYRPATASVEATRWVLLLVLPTDADLVPFAAGSTPAGPLALRSRFITTRRRP